MARSASLSGARGLWQGGRDEAATTPVLYLPTVTGGFITAIVASALGFSGWGQLAFGAGLLSWLAIESVLIHRLYTSAPLSEALRPTLGIQLAPVAAGAVASLSVTTGLPNLASHALLGYGLPGSRTRRARVPTSCTTT